VLMRHSIGFTDVVWAIDEIEGRELSYPKIIPNSILVRVQNARVIESLDGVIQ